MEDLDDKGNARPVGAGPATLNPLDKGQLMIRIRHKDPRGVAVKDHNAIIMRAGGVLGQGLSQAQQVQVQELGTRGRWRAH